MMTYDDVSEMTNTQRAGRERVMEIIVFLLAEMKEHKQITEVDLKPLGDRGFNQTEISTAFSWLFDKIGVNVALPNQVLHLDSGRDGFVDASRSVRPEMSFRVYHDVEQSVIAVEAQGYLLQLREFGLITDNDLELVIDRIMMSGVLSVSLPEVKELVSTMIFDFDDSTHASSRLMLNVTDRIQ